MCHKPPKALNANPSVAIKVPAIDKDASISRDICIKNSGLDPRLKKVSGSLGCLRERFILYWISRGASKQKNASEDCGYISNHDEELFFLSERFGSVDGEREWSGATSLAEGNPEGAGNRR